jgi:hypothetical protein
MSPTENIHGILPQLCSELQQALDRLSKGLRDASAAQTSREHMNKMREDNRQRFGVLNIGVDIIREMRQSR